MAEPGAPSNWPPPKADDKRPPEGAYEIHTAADGSESLVPVGPQKTVEKVVDEGVEREEAAAAEAAARQAELEAGRRAEEAQNNGKRAEEHAEKKAKHAAKAAQGRDTAVNGPAVIDSSAWTGAKSPEEGAQDAAAAKPTSPADLTPAEARKTLRDTVEEYKGSLAAGIAADKGAGPGMTMRDRLDIARNMARDEKGTLMPQGGSKSEAAAAKAVGEAAVQFEKYNAYMARRNGELDSKLWKLTKAFGKGSGAAFATVGRALGSAVRHPLKTTGAALSGVGHLAMDVGALLDYAGKAIANPAETVRAIRSGTKRGVESFGMYLIFLSQEERTLTGMLGHMVGDAWRGIGTAYQKLPPRYKVLTTFALLGGAVASGGALSGTLMGALYTQRLVAGKALSLSERERLEKEAATNAESAYVKMSEGERKSYLNALMLTYAFGTSAALYGVEHVAGAVLHGAPHVEPTHPEAHAPAPGNPPAGGAQEGGAVGGAQHGGTVVPNVPAGGHSAVVAHGPTAPHVAEHHPAHHAVTHESQSYRDYINWREHEESQYLMQYELANHGQLPTNADINAHLAEVWGQLHHGEPLPYGIAPDHPPVPLPRPEVTPQPLAGEPLAYAEAPAPIHAPEAPVAPHPVAPPAHEAITPTPRPEHVAMQPLVDKGFVQPYPVPPGADHSPLPPTHTDAEGSAISAGHIEIGSAAQLDSAVHTYGVTPDTVGAAVQAAQHLSVDHSLTSTIEPNTGVVPGPAIFLGHDGGLTAYGAAAHGDNFTAQHALATVFAHASNHDVKVLLPDGQPGYVVVHPNGSESVEMRGFFNFSYKPPLPAEESVYVFPRAQ